MIIFISVVQMQKLVVHICTMSLSHPYAYTDYYNQFLYLCHR